MKTCLKCNNEKELKEFFKDSSHKDGLTSSCKVCYKKYKTETKELQQEINKNHYSKNKEKIKSIQKDYYENNKEAHNKRMKKCFHYTNLRPVFKTTEIAESFGYKDQIGNRNRKKYEA